MHLSALPANMDDAILLESSGKEYLVADGSVKVGLTVTLNNAKIAFKSLGGPDWILCSIEGGNVVSVEDIYTSPRVYIPVIHPTSYISVERVSSSSATLSELAAVQYASYGGGVTVDIVNGVPGTAYNIGTIENPVNNIPDAITIANERGFEKFHIHNNLTLGVGHSVDGFEFVGHSPSKTTIIIESGASTAGCEFQECTVSGILDGNAILEHCKINTLNYVNGEIRNSNLIGPITLGGGSDSLFKNCGSSIPTAPPIIDMGGTGRNCIFHDYSGAAHFKNMTGSNYIGGQLDGGKIILDPTIISGSVIVLGIGLLIDTLENHIPTGTWNGGVTIKNYLVSADTVASAVWTDAKAISYEDMLESINKNTKLIPGLM
jgi:hypothetical protein